ESLDVVATEAILGSGFHERLHGWLPGLEEQGIRDLGLGIRGAGAGSRRPALMVPPTNPKSQIPNPSDPWFTCRDREEELVAIARQVKADRRQGDGVPLERTAAPFKAPSPFLKKPQQTPPRRGHSLPDR